MNYTMQKYQKEGDVENNTMYSNPDLFYDCRMLVSGGVVCSGALANKVVQATLFLVDCPEHLSVWTTASIWVHRNTPILHTIFFSIINGLLQENLHLICQP